jgi:FkbM family methyltransferase
MELTTTRHERGLWQAITSLFQFRQYFKNSGAVWSAYRTRTPLPPMVLKTGLTLHHDPADESLGMFREFFVDRAYTSKKFYNPRCGDVVVDIGGKIGFFALSMEWMARGVRIHTFEPSSERRVRLKRNVTTNRLNPFITVYPFIVGVAASPQLQTAGKAGLRSLEGRPNSSFSMLEVLPTLSLTEAIDLTGAAEVDLLKIESEGNEVAILEGADPETWSKIRRVVVKYHEKLVPDCRERMIETLVAHGLHYVETIPDRKRPGVGLIRATREP